VVISFETTGKLLRWERWWCRRRTLFDGFAGLYCELLWFILSQYGEYFSWLFNRWILVIWKVYRFVSGLMMRLV